MTAQPTAVVLPLPISTEQAQKMYKAYCAAFASSPETTRGQATAAAILAIGTPVAGGELEVAGWCHPQQLADLHIDNDNPDDERFVVMSRVKIGSRDIPLVRQSDAQAALAAAQAEHARLREAITTAHVSIVNGNPMKAAYVLEEELKGPEA